MDVRIERGVSTMPQKLEGYEALKSANSAQFADTDTLDLSADNQVPVATNTAPVNRDSAAVKQLASSLEKVLEGDADQAEASETLDSINKMMRERDQNLEFLVDDVTGKNVLKVKDSDSGDIIRQFPLEESLRVARFIIEGPSGLLDDMA